MLVRLRLLQHTGVIHALTRVGDSDSQQLIDDATHNLGGVVAGLVADRIAVQDAAAGQGRRLSDTRVVFLEWQDVLV